MSDRTPTPMTDAQREILDAFKRDSVKPETNAGYDAKPITPPDIAQRLRMAAGDSTMLGEGGPCGPT